MIQNQYYRQTDSQGKKIDPHKDGGLLLANVGHPNLNQNWVSERTETYYWTVWIPPTVQSTSASFEEGDSAASRPPLSPPESFSPAIASRS